MTTGSSYSLTLSEIGRLAADSSVTTRALVAGKLASRYCAHGFSEADMPSALKLIYTLLADTEFAVRQALSMQLCKGLNVPRDIMMRLAQDMPEIAAPVLAQSYVLSEDDLIAIVRGTADPARLRPIAERETISAALCDALIAMNNTAVLRILLLNPGAALQDAHIIQHWERFVEDPTLLQALIERGGLSLRIAEKLYRTGNDEQKIYLAQLYRLPETLMAEAAPQQRDWAVAELRMAGIPLPDETLSVHGLVEYLHMQGYLSHSLVVYALCSGDFEFFETAIARLAGVPRAIARILIFDFGDEGFYSLYERACLPEAYFSAIRALLEASLEETGYGRIKRKDFASRVIARIQGSGFDRTIEHMDYLLALIGKQGGVRGKAQTV